MRTTRDLRISLQPSLCADQTATALDEVEAGKAKKKGKVVDFKRGTVNGKKVAVVTLEEDV